MVTQDPRSQKSPRTSRDRRVSASTNSTNHQDDRWEDVETYRSTSPVSSASRRRRRRQKTEFVASQPSSARKQQWHPPQPAKRRHHIEYSGSSSGVDEPAPAPVFALRPAPEFALTPTLPLPLLPEFAPTPTLPLPLLPAPAPPPPVEPVRERRTADLAKDYATAIARYTEEVVARAFRYNSRVFSLMLGVTIVSLLLSMMTSQLVTFTRPICSLPIVSPLIPFCRWEAFKGPPTHTSAGRPVRWADYPRLVDMQTKTFDQLLDESIGGKGLASEVKKAEMAGGDLVTLVKASGLRSKDQIIERLSRFVDDARGTGRSLHALGSKINGAVDSITTLNDYALQTIEASKVPTSFVARVLPFSLSTTNPTQEAVIETFLMSMDNIASHVVRLRDEAEISMGHLMSLEQHLVVLHEITHRDNKELTAAQEDVLAELWTWLGGNKSKIRSITLSLDLLNNVETYRKKALAHIIATLQVLHGLDADMEELRTRVAAPDIVGDKIPIEIHMKSIKAGVERLKEGQMKASLKHGESIARLLEIDG